MPPPLSGATTSDERSSLRSSRRGDTAHQPPSTPILWSLIMSVIAGPCSQDTADLVDRGVFDASVQHHFAARHGDHAVAAFEHMVHVVADEHAGDALLLQAAYEADHLLGLLDRKV